MRLVIIGASGNVGTALLRRLKADGQHSIVGVTRRAPVLTDPYDAAGWESVDIAEPAAVETLSRIFAGADAVINLAWGFQPTRDEAYLEAVGVGGVRHVLQALTQAPVPQLVQMSSVGAYSTGSYGAPVDETYPTGGIPTSPYSRHKAAAERLLDDYQAGHPDVVITRPRPGLVLNHDAGSSLLRYALPALIPARAVGWLPVLPLDRRFAVPVVQADDLAEALLAMVEQRAHGPFNLAAPTALTPDIIGRALGARPVHLPRAALRAAVAASWRLHVQRLDPGWIDLAFAVPLMVTRRAHDRLGWTPRFDAAQALGQLVSGMTSAAGTDSPVLRKRTVGAELLRLREGPATERRLP